MNYQEFYGINLFNVFKQWNNMMNLKKKVIHIYIY